MKPKRAQGVHSGEPYTPCKLFYDGAREVEPGHFLKTPAGSAYRIDTVRRSRARTYRVYLYCLRWPVDEIPRKATVHPLHWYPRNKKAGRRLSELRL